jgi:hypothetical protein
MFRGRRFAKSMTMNVDMNRRWTVLEDRWREREREWAERLGRLRLGVEPIEDQLARYRRVTWGLMIVPAIISVMFLALFSVFGRPDIGLLVILILFVPMIVFSWLGFKRLERKGRAYLAERARYENERNELRSASTETPAAP